MRQVLITTKRVRHRLLRRPSPFKRVPITECTLMLETGVFSRPIPLDERFREYPVLWRWCMENVGPNLTGWMWQQNRVYFVEDAAAMAFVMRWRGAMVSPDMCAADDEA